MKHLDEGGSVSLSLSAFREMLAAWWYGYTSPDMGALVEYRDRFIGWWNGATPDQPSASRVHNAPHQMRTVEAPHAKGQNISAQLIVSQALWGEGNLTPGPADFIVNLASRLRLSAEMSMIDLGAGLGGPSRALNAAYGIWVTAYEWVEEIATAGMEQSIMHGMGRKVPILHFDPETAAPPERKIDCFFSKDALHLMPKKKPLLQAVKAALKSQGQFCIIDYVITKQGADSPHISAWNAAQEQISHFWSKEDYAAAITGMKLELRVADDITEQYCKMIADGFRQLTRTMSQLLNTETDPDRQSELRHALAFESNRWAVRLEAMHAGDIAVVRFSGIRH